MAKLVHEFLEESSRRLPGKVCLVHRGTRLTYADVEARANRLAQAFVERGVVRGDRVGIFLNNSVEAVIAIFAALKAGAAFVPINPTVKQNKLEYLIGSCRPAALVTHGSKLSTALPACRGMVPLVIAVEPPPGTPGVIPFEELVNQGSVVPPETVTIDLDLAAVIYTSSSTGPAKGVMLSHLNMVSAADSITTYLGNSRERRHPRHPAHLLRLRSLPGPHGVQGGGDRGAREAVRLRQRGSRPDRVGEGDRASRACRPSSRCCCA